MNIKHSFKYRLGQIQLLCLMLFLFSCSSKPPTAEELYKEKASGVVLVLNKYYYDVALPNGKHIYFNGINPEDGSLTGLTDDDKEIRNNCNYLTGTAFFIQKDGTLLTNRHVVRPSIDESQVKQSLNAIVRYIQMLYDSKLEEMRDEFARLENEKLAHYSTNFWGNYNPERANLISLKQEEISNEYKQMVEMRNNMANINVQNIKITPVCEIGLAYNDSYINNVSDFLSTNPCRVVRVEEDPSTDLALLQLKNGVTPSKAHVFSVYNSNTDSFTKHFSLLLNNNSERNNDKLRIDQQLYMIGYNAGINLANTRRGIKAQMTSGRITQIPDGDRLLYNIPTVQGSSGSPIIDEYGRLVGVNFAKLSISDNFNFGIPMGKVRRFVNKH